MLSAQLKALATRINKVVDLPWAPEYAEQVGLELLLEFTLGFLPPTYVGYLESAADGIDDTEAASVTEWLVELQKKYSRWPLPELAYRTVAGVVVSLLRKGAELAK